MVSITALCTIFDPAFHWKLVSDVSIADIKLLVHVAADIIDTYGQASVYAAMHVQLNLVVLCHN